MKYSVEGAAGKIYESGDRKLAYADEFRQLLREHPDALKDFQKIEDEVLNAAMEGVQKGDSTLAYKGHYEEGEVSVDLLDALGKPEGEEEGPGGIGEYMKASIAGHDFFVKRSAGLPIEKDAATSDSPRRSLGVDEFKSIQKAREMLRGIPDVEVIDLQFAYQRIVGKMECTYFVSKWVGNAVRLDQYFSSFFDQKFDTESEHAAAESKRQKLIERYDRIRSILGNDFDDVKTHNIMYDDVRDKFIIFDIHETAASDRWQQETRQAA